MMLNRLGLLPSLIIGAALIFVGSTLAVNMMNTRWLIDPGNPVFTELQRRAADGTIDSAVLYQNSQSGLIVTFLGCMLLIGMGVALPIAYLVNRRIRIGGDWEPASFSVLMRQGLWAGLLLAACAWLQMSRTLSIPIALLLLTIMLLVEAFIMIRQRSAETAA